MPLDSKANLSYTEGGSQRTLQPEHVACASKTGEVPMTVFLSLPNYGEKYQRVVRILNDRGLSVVTNFDQSDSKLSAERRTDFRLSRIRLSSIFVFFGSKVPQQTWSLVRQQEFGYALGCRIPVVYVGSPANSLHRYGDVFDDIDDFLRWFYSDEYYELMAKWLPNGSRQAAVA